MLLYSSSILVRANTALHFACLQARLRALVWAAGRKNSWSGVKERGGKKRIRVALNLNAMTKSLVETGLRPNLNQDELQAMSRRLFFVSKIRQSSRAWTHTIIQFLLILCMFCSGLFKAMLRRWHAIPKCLCEVSEAMMD